MNKKKRKPLSTNGKSYAPRLILDKEFSARPDTARELAAIVDGLCRFPVADGLFCAADCPRTRNYCDKHDALAWDSKKGSEGHSRSLNAKRKQ